MKNTTTLLLSLLLCVVSHTSHAQIEPGLPFENSIEYPLQSNDADHPCISPQQYELIEKQCNKNVSALGLTNSSPENLMITPLNWPLKAANGLNDCNFYGISAYVDQNANASAVTDYNCGTKTYDGHRGTDISIWPFPFFKMDNNQVEVIAAAAGTIIDKLDGNFDKNCASNNLNANYLVVQHADGSRVLYFHMKKNSLTTKAIGQTVAVGEYLGRVGSSGNSSGPHLHFEVWSGSTVATRVDPYSGPCNTLNANSWWANQKPYAGPEILKTSVHTTDAVLPACPETETPNESTCFSLPFQGPGLPPGAAKFYIFMRYETAGMTTNLSILNPDGTIFTSWTHASTSSFNASLKSWTKTLPTNSGTYTFRSELNGVTCSKPFDIISASITPSGPTTICQGNSVTLTASAASTYLWSTGATSQAINVSSSGNYMVTVSSTSGCSSISSAISVTVNPSPSTPSITPNGPTTFCQGNSVTLTASAASTYLWSSNATSQAITVSSTGNYIVTITNANGCSASSSATSVTVNPMPPVPTITPSGPTAICQGNSVTLTASAASTYLWSNNATAQAITVSNSGNYIVTITNANGCSAISTITSVTVNPLPQVPSITPSGPTTFCQGNSVTLSASAASTYLWSNGPTTQAITVSSTGNYGVTVTNANGCSAISTATSVTVNPLPSIPNITPSGPTTFCQGNSVTLSASAASTYLWSNGPTTQAITVSSTGNYGVTVTNANGCSAISNATSVTVNPLPSVPTITPSGATTFCQGSSVTLTASAASTYLWSNGATTQAITVSNSGNYGVTITNANGCSAISTATSVTVNPLPSVPSITPSGPTTFCQGNSVTLTASTASTYLWSNNATTQAITVSNAGNYGVTITNTNGCLAISTATSVTVNPLPPVPTITPSGPITFCQGNSVTLSTSAASTYLWSNGATAQAITVSNAGNYGVTVTNPNGCSAISTAISVTVYPSPLAPIITLIGTTLASSNPMGNQWYLNGNIIPNATAQTYSLTQNGDYTVLVTDANGCTASSTVFHYVHTGTETITESNAVLIVPNPNDGKFRVEMQNRSLQMEDLNMEVYNLLGEKVFMSHVQQLNPIIDISLQPGGTYFVKISGAKWKRVLPIIKI